MAIGLRALQVSTFVMGNSLTGPSLYQQWAVWPPQKRTMSLCICQPPPVFRSTRLWTMVRLLWEPGFAPVGRPKRQRKFWRLPHPLTIDERYVGPASLCGIHLCKPFSHHSGTMKGEILRRPMETLYILLIWTALHMSTLSLAIYHSHLLRKSTKTHACGDCCPCCPLLCTSTPQQRTVCSSLLGPSLETKNMLNTFPPLELH